MSKFLLLPILIFSVAASAQMIDVDADPPSDTLKILKDEPLPETPRAANFDPPDETPLGPPSASAAVAGVSPYSCGSEISCMYDDQGQPVCPPPSVNNEGRAGDGGIGINVEAGDAEVTR